MGKIIALGSKISGFQHLLDEAILEAWERFQEYIAACPHHGMEEWLIIQSFFHGLNMPAQNHIDIVSGGSFLSLDVTRARKGAGGEDCFQQELEGR